MGLRVWRTPGRLSSHRRFIRSAFALSVFHRNEQFGAEPGNRRRARVSLLNSRCLEAGRDESNSAAGEAGRAKAATRARVRQLRVISLPSDIRPS